MKKTKKSKRIKEAIKTSIELKEKVLNEKYLSNIICVAEVIVNTLRKNKKVLLCGNGGSASDCQHWAGEMVGRFKKERKPFKFISLTTNTSILTSIANDYDYTKVFSRQVEGLGEKNDILICISTSGKSKSILESAKIGKEKDMKIISLTGKSPNPLTEISDFTISVPSKETPRIQEIHILLIHLICELVEEKLMEC